MVRISMRNVQKSTVTLFNATISEGIPQKLEHNDIGWITTTEISNYDFSPPDKEKLEAIKKRQLGV